MQRDVGDVGASAVFWEEMLQQLGVALWLEAEKETLKSKYEDWQSDAVAPECVAQPGIMATKLTILDFGMKKAEI